MESNKRCKRQHVPAAACLDESEDETDDQVGPLTLDDEDGTLGHDPDPAYMTIPYEGEDDEGRWMIMNDDK